MEMCQFFCMIGGLILYLLVSKIFLVLRMKLSSQQRIRELKRSSDPYWTLLLTQQSREAENSFDFFEHDNFILETVVLMFANNMSTIFAATLIFGQIFHAYATAFITQFVLNFIMLVIVLAFIWKGTDVKSFYSKKNLIIIASLMAFQTTLTVWTCISNKIFTPYAKGEGLSRYFRNFKNDALLLITVNFVNNVWIKGEYLYYGVFKKQLDEGSLELLAEAGEKIPDSDNE